MTGANAGVITTLPGALVANAQALAFVPEPSTYVIWFALGSAGVAVLRRRRVAA